jgi:hypothetical protein
MKVDKQAAITTGAITGAIDARARTRTQQTAKEAPHLLSPDTSARDTRNASNRSDRSGGFNLQLNQQLSSMQSTDSYLSDLSEQLSELKLSLSRKLSSSTAPLPSPTEREQLGQRIDQLNQLVAQRSKRTAQSLDANLKLRLNEPLRSQFSIEGLESLTNVQQGGKETLLFTAGRALPEPVALVLDEGMSEEQILRRVNNSFGGVGIRAEVDEAGGLKFSMPETQWALFKTQLKIKGEGKRFAAVPNGIAPTRQDGLLAMDSAFLDSASLESPRDMRQLLESVVTVLDRIGNLRQHISSRQEDVRTFLAEQENQDEKHWALNFAGAVFNLKGRKASHYAGVTQVVVAQAQLSRFAVVSLLS